MENNRHLLFPGLCFTANLPETVDRDAKTQRREEVLADFAEFSAELRRKIVGCCIASKNPGLTSGSMDISTLRVFM